MNIEFKSDRIRSWVNDIKGTEVRSGDSIKTKEGIYKVYYCSLKMKWLGTFIAKDAENSFNPTLCRFIEGEELFYLIGRSEIITP